MKTTEEQTKQTQGTRNDGLFASGSTRQHTDLNQTYPGHPMVLSFLTSLKVKDQISLL